MAIRYKLIEKSQPGVAGGGIKKWYAQAVSNGEMSIDDLVQEIEKFSTLSEADIRAVIIALENVMSGALANGKIIRMDKLGSFYTGLSSEGIAPRKDFNVHMIKSVKVHYRPGKRIRAALKKAGFTKGSS